MGTWNLILIVIRNMQSMSISRIHLPLTIPTHCFHLFLLSLFMKIQSKMPVNFCVYAKRTTVFMEVMFAVIAIFPDFFYFAYGEKRQ